MSWVYGMTLRTITEAGMSTEKIISNHLQARAKNIASWIESWRNHPTTVSQQVTLHKNEAVSMRDNGEVKDYKRKGVMDGSWILKHAANREKVVAEL